MSYNYKYILTYVCLNGVDVYTIRKNIYKYWVSRLISNAINTDYLSLHLQRVQTNVDVAKINFSYVSNFHVELSCERYA